jgi:hypothetical protein
MAYTFIFFLEIPIKHRMVWSRYVCHTTQILVKKGRGGVVDTYPTYLPDHHEVVRLNNSNPQEARTKMVTILKGDSRDR